MRVRNLGWVAIGLMTSLSAWSQTAVDEVALKRLPETFSSGWATHQGSELAKIVSEDVDFVNVGAIWLHGAGRFRQVSHANPAGTVQTLHQQASANTCPFPASGPRPRALELANRR